MRRILLCLALLILRPDGTDGYDLPVPRAVEALAVSPTEIRVYWLPSPGANGYRILRDDVDTARLPATTTEYDDTKCAPDSLHTYVVQALQDGPGSEFAPSCTERTFPEFPVSHSGEPRTGSRRNFPPAIRNPERKSQNSMSETEYDVVVVQASSGGVAAAIEAARRGLKVALIEPTTRIGGMPVNGLSASDLRRDYYQSGFFVRFRQKVTEIYKREGRKEDGRKYEPRVAHQAMKELLYATPNITLFRRTRLAKVKTKASETDENRRCVESVTIEELDANGQPTKRRAEFKAKIFIDATDCGDLAAWAGAPFRVGREPKSEREPHNGVIYYDRKTQKAIEGSTGAGDRRVQSYAYLLTVKDYGAGTDKTLPTPPGYKREEFLDPALPTWKSTWASSDGVMPNGKFELNQHPKGNDLQGINYAYPTTNYAKRAQIEAQYRARILRYLYFIQTEYGMKNLGLPDDEYRDSGGFPPLLYVREGRRILGEQVPDEASIADARSFFRPESIGIGDYPMDSHAVRPRAEGDTKTMGEGEWWLVQRTPWHQLPLGVIVPQRLDNVFVTTAVSSTHVSYGTYRLEPVRMAFGQAAAIASYLAIRYHLRGRDVPARQIQDELLPHFANPYGDPNIVLHYFPDVSPTDPNYRAIQFLASRGFLPEGEKFAPNSPVTPDEMNRWFNLLGKRGAEGRLYYNARTGATFQEQDSPTYMGSVLKVEEDIRQFLPKSGPITRAEFAKVLTSFTTVSIDPLKNGNMYKDTESDVRRVAAFLYAAGVDSRLWDSWDAYAPDGKLLFRPDKPITHTEAFAAMYILQIGLGPLFNDHPVDGLNGRSVPAAPKTLKDIGHLSCFPTE